MCTIDMHIRYSLVKKNYRNILRLDGKTISNGELENICCDIFYMRMTNEISQRDIGNIYYYIYYTCSSLFAYRNRYAANQ